MHPDWMTLVVNYKHRPCDIRITRPSMWGNPFIIGVHGNRQEVVARYEKWLPTQPRLMAALPGLRGKILGCVCAPLRCHGEVLARMANTPRKTWVICDSNYLCRRAFYSMGQLQYNDIMTGVLFGFLRDVVALLDLFDSDSPIFCFDRGRGIRKDMCPMYKKNRDAKYHEASPEERASMDEFRRQVVALADEYLPALGYKNVFYQEGYEGDDIIANLCQTLPPGDEIVIVSADEDLHQLLVPGRVVQYNPHKRQTTTAESFHAQWGLEPDQWADVLALAGCDTDEVPGIKGVGKATAAAYLRGELNPKSKAYAKCHGDRGQFVWRRNLRVVKLPLEGTPMYDVRPDTVTREKWCALTDRYGLRSLRDQAPITTRAARASYGKQKSEGFGIRA